MLPPALYNEVKFFAARLKRLAKKIIGLPKTGPDAVFISLSAGLAELGEPFLVNPRVAQTACVLSGTRVLRWAIAQKAKGKIQKIAAGPNIVVSPTDSGGILRDPKIDAVIVPSQWVKDFYAFVAPELSDKIFIWPAGVDLPPESGTPKTLDFLILSKTQNTLGADIAAFLAGAGYKTSVFKYGKYRQENYFKALNKARFLIYLSESESQGLAMFEAWARGVPTLVWERGFWQNGSNSWSGLTASPYLHSQTGMRFKDFGEFKAVLPKFLSGIFSPREYIAQNFTRRKTAQNYLNILKKINA